MILYQRQDHHQQHHPVGGQSNLQKQLLLVQNFQQRFPLMVVLTQLLMVLSVVLVQLLMALVVLRLVNLRLIGLVPNQEAESLDMTSKFKLK